MSLQRSIKSVDEYRWDLVSLGEVMLRLDPGEGRVRTTRDFRVSEGGGEYNVARGLRRCFGLRTSIVTGVVDNEVGRLLEDLILQGGVDTSLIEWMEFDGIGKRKRNALNFTERGFGVRAAKGCSDRAHSASSQIEVGDIDWDTLFNKDGVRWFHCGGIFAGLSKSASAVALEAMKVAKAAGTIVSYDLNYRTSLWQDIGGQTRAQEVNRGLAPYVDVMIGNEEDFSTSLGFEVDGVGDDFSGLSIDSFKLMIERVVAEYPNLSAVATTLRNAKTATVNDWGAILYDGGTLYEARHRPDLEILDRVGGGDSFASGLIYGYLMGEDAQACVEYGAAHGALAMTTRGDTTMATLEEVKAVMWGAGARVDR
jgi:2-dehydro-3-deoxygluconokinase